jgi:4-oxalocrotonate tautomerase
MPIVRVEMWTGRTVAQKKELARVITDAMVNIAHTTPEATIIVFEDIDRDNWAQSGALASEED